MKSEALAQAIHDFQCAHRDLLACALVYGVGHPALYGELMQWFGPETEGYRLALVFDATPEDSDDQYGPFLVRLASGKKQPSRLLRKLSECCGADFRSVSFLFSGLEFEELKTALRERLDVVCEDHSEWQMKFFDTRSLDVLNHVLSGEQRASFFCLVKEWWHVDRNEILNRIEGEASKADSYEGPLRLSEQQTNQFIDAGLPDAVLYSLRRTDDDLLSMFDAHAQYRICEQSIASASDEERNSSLLLEARVREALFHAAEESQLADEPGRLDWLVTYRDE